MKLILTVFAVCLLNGAFAQNIDLIGTWTGYNVQTGNPKKFALADSSSFKSVLSMNSDSTFTLITRGHEIVMGNFTAGPNFIILFKLVGFEDYERYWDIRWTKGNDPYEQTSEIDMLIPTMATVLNKKKNTTGVTQVYVLYKKTE
ncbi:MAG: hypothetical protein HRT72_04530, partial [Flavobacteriales bacterium]|nr:hypothetical protein [Flavobacteriales bacterium]